MKSFSQFLKEEIDLRGNQGIPDDFISNADRQARANLGVNIDDPRQLGQYGPQIGRLIAQSQQIMNQGLNREQLRERKDKLEKLAYDIVMSEYGEILEASEKPVDLIIKFVEEGNVTTITFGNWAASSTSSSTCPTSSPLRIKSNVNPPLSFRPGKNSLAVEANVVTSISLAFPEPKPLIPITPPRAMLLKRKVVP